MDTIDDLIDFIVHIRIWIDIVDIFFGVTSKDMDDGINGTNIRRVDWILDMGRELVNIRHEEGTSEETSSDNKNWNGNTSQFPLNSFDWFLIQLDRCIFTLFVQNHAIFAFKFNPGRNLFLKVKFFIKTGCNFLVSRFLDEVSSSEGSG